MADAKTPDAYFEKLEAQPAKIAKALRQAIVERWPHLELKLAWGFPCWSGQERVFSIIAHKDRCNLQLWQGADLAGAFPERIEGTGKSLRHVKVFHPEEIDAELLAIMAEAVKIGATCPRQVR